MKKGIGNKISGDDLIEYLQKNCPFKIIESDQSCYVYSSNINAKKKLRCQQLLYSTSSRSYIRTDVDSFIVQIICYDKDGLVVNGYSNVLMELKCIIRFINLKNEYATSFFVLL